MYDDVLSSQYGVDNKNCFSISPESIQLKPELRAKIKIEDELPDRIEDLEVLVDEYIKSHNYAR